MTPPMHSFLAPVLLGLPALAGSALAQSEPEILFLGQTAAGTASLSAAIDAANPQQPTYFLTWSGDEMVEYAVRLSDPDVQRGLLEIRETTSGVYPVVDSGPYYLSAVGAPFTRPATWMNATTVSHTVVGDAVVLEYQQVVAARPLHWRYTIRLRGKGLQIDVDTDGTDLTLADNLNGLFTGPNDAANDELLVQIQSSLALPIVSFVNGGARRYMATHVDFFQSNATTAGFSFYRADGSIFHENGNLNPLEPNAAEVVQFGYRTQYKPSSELTTGGQQQTLAPLRERLNVMVSSRLSDCFVNPPQGKSPYRDQLANRTVVQLTQQKGQGNVWEWADTQVAVDKLGSLGMHELAHYVWFPWQACPGGGAQWFPARQSPFGNGTMQELFEAANNHGHLIGAYTLFAGLLEGPGGQGVFPYPVATTISDYAKGSLNPAQLSKNENLVDKDLNGAYGPDLTESGALVQSEREMGWMVHGDSGTPNFGTNTGLAPGAGPAGYDASLALTDVMTYLPPHATSGDHITQDANSPAAKTLRQACRDRLEWLDRMAQIAGGPLLGEGSFAQMAGTMDWLWAGSVDAGYKGISAGVAVKGNGALALNNLITDCQNPPAAYFDYAPTQWHVVPEYDQRVYGNLQANFHTFWERFYTQCEIATTSPQVLFEKRRLYELTYAHAALAQIDGIQQAPLPLGGGQFRESRMIAYVSQHHLVQPLQALYLNLDVQDIHYWHAGAWKTFEEVLAATGTMDSFQDPVLRIRYGQPGAPYALQMFLNHSTADFPLQNGTDFAWSTKTPGLTVPTTVTIGEDGWLAHAPNYWQGEDLMAFTGKLPGEARAHYMYAPGRWEYVDSQGAGSAASGSPLAQYFGIAQHGRYIVLEKPLENLRCIEVPGALPPIFGDTFTTGAISATQPQVSSLSVELESATSLEVGTDTNARVFATYSVSGQPVGWRDVTTEATLTSSQGIALEFDRGGAVRANAPVANATLTANFGGITGTLNVSVLDPQVDRAVVGYGQRSFSGLRIPEITIEDPLVAGGFALVEVTGVPAGAPVVLYAGTQGGLQTVLPIATPGEQLISWASNPFQVGSATANSAGEAQFIVPIPAGLTGAQFVLQGIVADTDTAGQAVFGGTPGVLLTLP